jgi:hypothetical protein
MQVFKRHSEDQSIFFHPFQIRNSHLYSQNLIMKFFHETSVSEIVFCRLKCSIISPYSLNTHYPFCHLGYFRNSLNLTRRNFGSYLGVTSEVWIFSMLRRLLQNSIFSHRGILTNLVRKLTYLMKTLLFLSGFFKIYSKWSVKTLQPTKAENEWLTIGLPLGH